MDTHLNQSNSNVLTVHAISFLSLRVFVFDNYFHFSLKRQVKSEDFLCSISTVLRVDDEGSKRTKTKIVKNEPRLRALHK